MKKKLVSALMCATMAVTMLAGCGNGSKNGTEAADGGTEAAESEVVTNTYGDSKGTHLEMWTFVELHAQHYGTMVEQWNKDHPDKTIEITCTTYPYADMHTKLLTSLEAGTGAPDICDVEVVLPQLSVSLLPHIAQFCFQQLSVTFSVHSTFYHFEPAVSSLYKTIAIVISYRIFNSIQIVFQTFSKTS